MEKLRGRGSGGGGEGGFEVAERLVGGIAKLPGKNALVFFFLFLFLFLIITENVLPVDERVEFRGGAFEMRSRGLDQPIREPEARNGRGRGGAALWFKTR